MRFIVAIKMSWLLAKPQKMSKAKPDVISKFQEAQALVLWAAIDFGKKSSWVARTTP